MKMYERIETDAAVLTLEGKLMGDPDTPKVHERVKELTKAGIRDVIVDLELLAWLNSAGLGILIASMTTARRAGGDLVLANVHGKSYELIGMTHLDQVFTSFDSVEKALTALRGKSGKRN
jgi:anti-sigma B factor antagonist